MNKGRQTLRQGDIAKALKAAKAAGLEVVGFDVEASGRITVRTANGAVADMTPDPFDKWKASRDARPA